MNRIQCHIRLSMLSWSLFGLLAFSTSFSQNLPKDIGFKPFYDISKIGMAKDKTKAIGMWEVPSLPGHFYILDQHGKIFTLYPDDPATMVKGIAASYSREKIADFTAKTHAILRAEWGAYSIQFHPQFPRKNLFYVIYTGRLSQSTGRSPSEIRVEEWTAGGAKFNQVQMKRKIIGFPHSPSYGVSLMHFGPDGYLYISFGDYVQNPVHGDRLIRFKVTGRSGSR